MSTIKFAPNVEAYEPEANPHNIDLEAMRSQGWPPELVELVARQRRGSDILHKFEKRRAAEAEHRVDHIEQD
jgi:hypothetical protein